MSCPFFKGKISIEIPDLVPVKDTIIYNYFLIQRLEIFINNNQEIKSLLYQEQLTKLKDKILKQAPVNKKSTEVVTFIKNQLKPDDNLSQLINAEVEKILKLAIVPKGYTQDYLLNKQYPIENLFEQMNQEKEFKTLSEFLNAPDS